jgi:hypothetical protein
MSPAHHVFTFRIASIVIATVGLLSCASSGGSSAARDAESAAVDSSKKSEQQLQAELMSFADRFFAETPTTRWQKTCWMRSAVS